MLENVVFLCMGILTLAMLLNVARLVEGPNVVDRVLALDTLYINALALIVLFGIWLASDLFFEAALLIAVMGFVSTVAVGKHLLHGDIID
ncbi:Na(+)/H(+) antiporter subunit F [Pseudomonas oleovorans subsp. oleovorans]|uniref:Multiple resistance and pH regulation protein F n=1 Tax=Ectopseudomonas oleovorans TaxID=301 RepID=A0A2S7FS91_ECTOL|nr:K+/H+ antiporter subunit F [Pseudomonas oleovorans]OWK49129.1 Na(+)/H(+) antiporter subunit F [Pseudomonas oleovorans subsp. oleovorans]PPV42391.1 K+/H+ antiporter subunit F [Pseudomonas oleovorans]SEJ90163.1 multisubunit potassium/proton antiporter, PhaF subunit [Pseudomonas oleovorans]SUD52581.1 multiple resistance and pH regulation protein F [Pseudomonas oleovorans]